MDSLIKIAPIVLLTALTPFSVFSHPHPQGETQVHSAEEAHVTEEVHPPEIHIPSTLERIQEFFRGFTVSPGVSLTEFTARIEDKKKGKRTVMVNQLGDFGFHFNLFTPRIEMGPVDVRFISHSSLFSIDRTHLETTSGKQNIDLGSEISGFYSYFGPVFYLGPLGLGAGYGALSLSGNAWFSQDIQESSPRELREVKLTRQGVWALFLSLEMEYKNGLGTLSAAALRTSTRYNEYDFDEGKLAISYIYTY